MKPNVGKENPKIKIFCHYFLPRVKSRESRLYRPKQVKTPGLAVYCVGVVKYFDARHYGLPPPLIGCFPPRP